jgi:hydroxymethylpyrimidine/phosphomethylpyrimidine kinase
MDRIPIALTIAGSDSGGGAGIQADLKTFHQYNVHGCSVITAVTAQNTREVSAVHPVPPQLIRSQLAAVSSDLPPDAVKTGMLFDRETIRAVEDGLALMDTVPFVLDPVMISTSGDRLLDEAAQSTLVESLLGRATLVTPNLPEAEALAGTPIRDLEDMRRAGRAILEMGAAAVLVKGGHLPGPTAVDLLITPDAEHSWQRPRLRTRHTHGTGCTLSAAITAALARGSDLTESVSLGLGFVARALASAPGIGSGHGPLNHFVRP